MANRADQCYPSRSAGVGRQDVATPDVAHSGRIGRRRQEMAKTSGIMGGFQPACVTAKMYSYKAVTRFRGFREQNRVVERLTIGTLLPFACRLVSIRQTRSHARQSVVFWGNCHGLATVAILKVKSSRNTDLDFKTPS